MGRSDLKVVSLVLIESLEVDLVVLACTSGDCGGQESEHESETLAYWETHDSGVLITRSTCRRCSAATTIRRWIGPVCPLSHDCAYYADASGVCLYCSS